MVSNTKTILLLEPESAVAARIQDALTVPCLPNQAFPPGQGFVVVTVTGLDAAIDYLKEHSVALMLVAVNLQDKNNNSLVGAELIEKIIEANTRTSVNTLSPALPSASCLELATPLIVLCEQAEPEQVQDFLMRGAEEVIEKSRIDNYWFPRVLHHCIEHAQSHRAMETILRSAEDALFAQQERAQVTLNSIGDAVLTTNLAGKITYLNPVAETMTGWTLQEALGLPLEDVFSVIDGDSREAHPNPVRRALAANKTVKLTGNSLLVRRDGIEIPIEDSVSPIHDRHKAVSGAVMVFHDVSDARAMAKKILHMAQHDQLTGLANRSLLTERLNRALGLAKRKNKKVGLLFIDVDRFKEVNDSFGHAIGDRLLQSIALRLESLVRATDTVCRQGGDEFVVLLTEITEAEHAAQVAEKMLAAFIKPHYVHEMGIVISLSIGIGIYPDHCADIDALFHHADAAMYSAKMAGRNNYQFYGGSGVMPLVTANGQ